MTIDEFFSSTPEILLSGLELYQQDLIKGLLASTNDDYEKAADLWLSAAPAQTANFGGDPTHLKVYREKVLEEIEKFVCSPDDTYKEERTQLRNNANATQQYFVAVLSTAIGGNLGVAGAFIAPIIVLLIISFGRMSINAWCKMRSEQGESS